MLIEQSIAKQYGVLPSDQDTLHYSDWSKLVSGLMDDTPLGRVVGVRMENDPEMLKHYTPEQHRLRREWQQFLYDRQRKQIENNPEKKFAYDRQIADLERMLAGLAGGEQN